MTPDNAPKPAELREKLDALGIDYPEKASGVELYHLLVQAQRSMLADVTGVPEEQIGGRRLRSVPEPEPDVPAVQVALAYVMREIDPIPKAQRADQKMGGYAFRGIDQFYTAAQPILAKHGVVVTPKVLHVERDTYSTGSNRQMTRTLLTVRYRFTGPRGDHLDATVIGEGSDTSDKSATKALSTAAKYALMQVLMVPVEGGHDADQHEPAPEGPPLASPDQLRVLNERTAAVVKTLGSDHADVQRIKAARDAAGWPHISVEQAAEIEALVAGAEAVADVAEVQPAAKVTPRHDSSEAENVPAPPLESLEDVRQAMRDADLPMVVYRTAPDQLDKPCGRCRAPEGEKCADGCVMWEDSF